MHKIFDAALRAGYQGIWQVFHISAVTLYYWALARNLFTWNGRTAFYILILGPTYCRSNEGY